MFNFPVRSRAQQEVIDPRAQYQRQSKLADSLMQQAMQYRGGGWAEALAMMLNAYNANKIGQQAEGSLSEALRLEQEKEAQEAAEAERIRNEDFQRRLAEGRALADARAAAAARYGEQQLTPEQELQNALDLYRGKAEIDAELRPREPRQPTQQELAFQRIDQLVERGELTQQQGEQAKNNYLNIDPADPETELSADERKNQQALDSLTRGLREYRGLLERYGTEYGGTDAAALDSAYSAVLTAAKEAERMGALSGPDLGLMQGIVGQNPTGFFAQFNPRGAANRIAQIDQYARMKGIDLSGQSDIVDPFAGNR